MEKNNQILDYYKQLKNYFDCVIIGEERAKKAIISAMMCDNNSRILLTGDTGTGKTLLVKNLARLLKSTRIQITADLLPSEILELLKDKDFELVQLDEANRANGRAQSSLIELSEENQITTESGPITFDNFYLIATQNAREAAGIFNTPYANLDRYRINAVFGNLTDEERERVLFDHKEPNPDSLPKINLKEIVDYTTEQVDNFVPSEYDRKILTDAFNIIRSRQYKDKKLFFGSNIRADKSMIRLAIFHALMNGRDYIMPSDIADYIPNVYLHRIDQSLVKTTDEEAMNIMKEFEETILNMERENEVGQKILELKDNNAKKKGKGILGLFK